MELQVAPCTHKAARFAVERWHYSRRLPVGKLAKYGVWEDGTFAGAVLFSWGANHNLSKPYGLAMTEVVELVRVALRDHQAPVTQVVARALRLLRQQSPGLRLVVSFADPHHGHLGVIYQAGNWLYLGPTEPKRELFLRGVQLNRRAYTGHQFGKPGTRAALPRGAEWRLVPGKHRYVMPLDRAMRRRLAPQALPFPRGSGLRGEPAAVQAEGPGSIPGDRSPAEAVTGAE